MIDDPRFDDEIAAAAPRGKPASVCPTDAALASFYAGELAEREDDALREHLASCAACVERARDAAAFAETMKGAARHLPHARRLGPVPAWGVAMAAVFAAAAILVLWRTATPPPPTTSPDVASAQPAPGSPDARARWLSLPVEAAPYVPDKDRGILWRGGEQPAAAVEAGSFAWAMEPYREGDFPGAADRLGQRLRADANDERARFYFGVSLLIAGHPDESVEPLRRVAEGRGPLAGSASWYLAVACLKTGDDDRAAAALRELVARGDDRAARARELLGTIEAQKKR